MAEVASAYVSLIPSAQGFGSGISKAIGGDVDRAGKSAGSRMGKGFKGTFLTGLKGIAAPLAGLFAVSGGVSFLKDANAEAREAQKVGALTAATIKATGGAAKVTAKQVGDLAGALSKRTGIDDEVIQSGQNMLLTFKNIRNEQGKGNDVFGQSTKALVDMSSAMGTEPKQAAIQLGKALNDPIKGVASLGRVGVQFTDQQKEQIKALVEGGKTMDAQKIVLKELNSQFGGAAEAQATAGDKLSVTWGNFKEQIGTALLPVIDKLATFLNDKILPAVSGFIGGMTDGTGAGGKFADAAREIGEFISEKVIPVIKFLAKNALEGLRQGFGYVKQAIQDNRPFLESLWESFKKVAGIVAEKVIPVIGLIIRSYLPTLGKAIGIAIEAIKRIVDAFLGLAEFGTRAFRILLTAAFNAFDGILTAADKSLGWIPKFGPKIKEARAAFDDFGDKTIEKLKRTEAQIKRVRDAINGIKPEKEIRLNVILNASGKVDRMLGLEGRAFGGRVLAGTPYVVGERRPEVFVPDRSGRIIPRPKMDVGAGASGPQEIRGTLSIDRDGVAYIHGIAAQHVQGNAAAGQAARRAEAVGAVDFR